MEPPPLKLVMVQGPRQGETLEFRPGQRGGLDGEVLGGNSGILDRDVVAADHAADSDSGSGSEF
jgi:hypothetical protein